MSPPSQFPFRGIPGFVAQPHDQPAQPNLAVDRLNNVCMDRAVAVASALNRENRLRFMQQLRNLQQQRQEQLATMTGQNARTNPRWTESLGVVQPGESMDYPYSHVSADQSPQNLMMDHTMSAPNGYGYGVASGSPASAPSDSSPVADSVSFPSMFSEFSTGLGQQTGDFPEVMRARTEAQGPASFYPGGNIAAAPSPQGFDPSPSTSPPAPFLNWTNSSQASEIDLGFLAPPRNVFGGGDQYFGSNPTPVPAPVGPSTFPPRAMSTASSSFMSLDQDSYPGSGFSGGNSSRSMSFSAPHHRQHPSVATTATESFPSAADSPDTMASIGSTSFSDSFPGGHDSPNYALSSSATPHAQFSYQSSGSALPAGVERQIQQHHAVIPSIVFPAGHNENMGHFGHEAAMGSHTTLAGFDNNHNPIWSQPSPNMTTSTESLPRVMIPAYAEQQGTGNILDASYLQARGQTYPHGTQAANEPDGLPQIIAPRPRRPLPSSRSVIHKKDKRTRGSVSRSPSPPPSSTPTHHGLGRPRKQHKRGPDNTNSALRANSSVKTLKNAPNANASTKSGVPLLSQVPSQVPEEAYIPSSTGITRHNPMPDYIQTDTPNPFSSYPINNPNMPENQHITQGTNNQDASRRPESSHSSSPQDEERKRKDAYLLWAKDVQKMTYSQIKKLGNFTEAESTLRGRYRTLNKRPEDRIRKPRWTDIDIRLLERGVRLLATTSTSTSSQTPRYASNPNTPGHQQVNTTPSSTGVNTLGTELADLSASNVKIPWRKVADYIADNGGTYHFGNSTCRKRWDALVEEHVGRMGKDIRVPFCEDLWGDIGEDEGYDFDDEEE